MSPNTTNNINTQTVICKAEVRDEEDILQGIRYIISKSNIRNIIPIEKNFMVKG